MFWCYIYNYITTLSVVRMRDHAPVLQHHHSESFFQPTLPIKVYSFLPFISIQHTPCPSSYLYSPLLPPFIPRPSLTSLHSKVSPALAIFGHWSIQPHGSESPAAKWQNEPFAARIWWGGDGKTWRSWKLFGKVWLWSEKQLCHFPHILHMYIVAFLTDVFCINLPTSCYKLCV